MKQKSVSKSRIQGLRVGDYGVEEDRIKAVLRVLALQGNKTPHIKGITLTLIGHAAVTKGLPATWAREEALNALHYLFHFKYIDWGCEGEGNHFFVRNARWMGWGKQFQYPRLKANEQFFGFPFKWWDPACVHTVNAVNLFNGLSTFRDKKSAADGSTRWIHGVNQAQMGRTAPCLAMSGGEVSKALEILTTWNLVRQVVRRGQSVPDIELAFFNPVGDGRIEYRDPIPDTPPFPAPGYLGDIPELRTAPTIVVPALEPPAPAVPRPPVDTPVDAPEAIREESTQGTMGPIEAHVEASVGLEEAGTPVINHEDPPSFIWDPRRVSGFMADVTDYGVEVAVFLMQLTHMARRYPSHPNGSPLDWAKGPSVFPGDFGDFFPWSPVVSMKIMLSMENEGRLEVWTNPDGTGTFYRVIDRIDAKK